MPDENPIHRCWYLIHSKPNQESVAKENLERQGYKTYLPLIPTRRKRSGKSIHVIAPMFPRYLFIYLSDQVDNWGPIRSTLGVANLVSFGKEPAKIPDKLINALKDRETEDGLHPIENKEFSEGEKVRVTEGPFEGYEAVFSSQHSKERVIILLSIAEQYAKLKINCSSLEKID